MRQSVGIELSDTIKSSLGSVQEHLASDYKEVTWLRPEQMYLTILFLGNPFGKIRRKLDKSLTNAAAQCAPFSLEVGETGCFPEQGPVRTVWVSMKDVDQIRPTMFERFQKECLNSFKALGLELPDKPFIPHVVLGRVSSKNPKGPLRSAVSQIAFTGLKQDSHEVCLIESKLGKDGPTYNVSVRKPLAAQIAK